MSTVPHSAPVEPQKPVGRDCEPSGEARRKRIDWTPEQDAYIRARYRSERRQAIAAALGLSVHAVRFRARVLGVTRTQAKSISWTPERCGLVRRLYGFVPVADIAAQLGVTTSALHNQAGRLGITGERPRAEMLDAAERNYDRVCIILAWKMSLLSGPEAARALGTSQARLPELATRLAMWGARQAEQGKEAAS